jgi:hypothetical protein
MFLYLEQQNTTVDCSNSSDCMSSAEGTTLREDEGKPRTTSLQLQPGNVQNQNPAFTLVWARASEPHNP